MKNIRNNQPCISVNFCTEFNEAQVFPVSIVNIKFGFMDWFLYYFILLIKQCKILYKTLDKALLFSRNQVICLKNRKLWRAPANIFFWNFVSYLSMSTKGCLDFF